MSDRDDTSANDPLAHALRAMYTSQAEAAEFEPLEIPAATAARHWSRRRRSGLFLAAAAVTLVAGAGALVAQPLLRPPPVPASPAPGDPTQEATPAPTRTPFTGGGGWSWTERARTPLAEFDMSNAISIDGVDYYVTMLRKGAGEPPADCLLVQIHRYLPESGSWEEQGQSPAPPDGLCPFQPVAYGGDLYVTLYDGGPVTEIAGWHLGETNPVLVYRPATGSWTLSDPFPTRPHAYLQEHCVPLPTGMFCAETTTGDAFTGRYEVLDLPARTWREGTSADLASIPVSPIGDIPRRVTVEGRSLVLFTTSPVLRSEAPGEMTVFLLDPESGAIVLRTSRELTFGQLEAIRDPQVVAPGLLYGGPETVHDELATATFLDLRTGEWWDVAVPGPSPYPADINDSFNHLDSAAWAKRVWGDELATYAVIRDYLYDPLQDRWIVLPVVAVPPPDVDPPEGDEVQVYVWYGSGPLKCDYRAEKPCYELRADQLARVAQDLTHEQVMARPTTVR